MVVIVLIALIGIAIAGMQRGRVGQAWGEAAGRLGMTMRSGSMVGYPQMYGQFGDVAVNVSVYSTGGKNQQRHTSYEVRHPPIGPVVTMTRQGLMSGIFGAVTGRKDVLVGDPLFDDRVVVHAHDETGVRDFLTPARRAAVQELFAVFDRAEITRDSISVSNRGVSSDPNEITATVLRLVDMATVLGDVQFNRILGHRHDGHLARAAEELHDFNQGRGNRFSTTLEAEAMTEAGQHQQATDAFEELWAGQPDDPVSSGWYDVAARAEPPPPSPAVAETTIGTAQQAVLDDIFASDRMSWEVVEHFATTYRGAGVEWSGTVTRVEHYQQDGDFPGGPGVKAVVAIGQAGRAGVVSNEVSAVVELDAGVALEVGAPIRFRGVLTSVDRSSRQIWVRHGTLG